VMVTRAFSLPSVLPRLVSDSWAEAHSIVLDELEMVALLQRSWK
jgi:hypothetical protein